MSTALDAPITAVTVYPGQARVTRRGTLRLDRGDQRVHLGGLPLSLHADSVRVSGSGPAAVLGVDVRPERRARTPDPVLAELRERGDGLRLALAELDDREAALATRAELLTGVARRSGAAFAQALARAEADTARVADAGAGLADELARVLGEKRELALTRERLRAEHEEVRRRVADRDARQQPDRVAVEVELAVAEAGEVALEVSYVVDAAGWESRYDIRLAGDALTLVWYGLVTQRTGEDWPECELRLSTARPASTVVVPELSPWYLDVPRPVVPLPAGGARFAAAPALAMVESADAAMAPVPAAVEHGTTASTYRPARPVAVPADGTAHRATVAAIDLSARLDHVTVPLRGPEAYVRATVGNTSEHTVRPGRASLFHDGEFVGVTDLAVWAPGEEVELALGVDDRVRVERELVRRSTGKAVLGGTRRQEAAYRITVANHGPRPARITVVDQVPVSRSESIVVREVALRPEPAERDELGQVTWRLELAPGARAEVELAVRVDVAKGVELLGWRD